MLGIYFFWWYNSNIFKEELFMAKKGKTGYLGMIAFGAMLINAIAWLLKIIFEALNTQIIVAGQPLQNLLTGISSLLLLIVAIVVAYDFAERQTKGWRIVFWVLTIISLLAIFFGLGLPNFIK